MHKPLFTAIEVSTHPASPTQKKKNPGRLSRISVQLTAYALLQTTGCMPLSSRILLTADFTSCGNCCHSSSANTCLPETAEQPFFSKVSTICTIESCNFYVNLILQSQNAPSYGLTEHKSHVDRVTQLFI